MEFRILGPSRRRRTRYAPARPREAAGAACRAAPQREPDGLGRAASSRSLGRRATRHRGKGRSRHTCHGSARSCPRAARTRAPGYVLELEAGRLDLDRSSSFRRRAGSARRGGEPERAAACARRRALALAGPGARRVRGGAALASARERGLRSCGLPRSRSGSTRSSPSAAMPLVGELESLVARPSSPGAPTRSAHVRALPLRPQAEALKPYSGCAPHPRRAAGIEPGRALRDLEQADPPSRSFARRRRPPRPSPRERPSASCPGLRRRRSRSLRGPRVELARLRAALGERSPGAAGSCMLAGEPGIGKTRLAVELAREARRDEGRVLWGRCYERRERRLLAVAPGGPPVRRGLRSGAAARRAGRGCGGGAEVVPEVRARLGTSGGRAASGREAGALPAARLAGVVSEARRRARAAGARARGPRCGRRRLARSA